MQSLRGMLVWSWDQRCGVTSRFEKHILVTTKGGSKGRRALIGGLVCMCNKRSILHVNVRLGGDFAGSQKTGPAYLNEQLQWTFSNMMVRNRIAHPLLKWMFASLKGLHR